MERFTEPQKQSLGVSSPPPPQKCHISSASLPVNNTKHFPPHSPVLASSCSVRNMSHCAALCPQQFSGQLMFSKEEKPQRLFSVTRCDSPFNSSLGNFCSRTNFLFVLFWVCIPKVAKSSWPFLLLDTRNNFFIRRWTRIHVPLLQAFLNCCPFTSFHILEEALPGDYSSHRKHFFWQIITRAWEETSFHHNLLINPNSSCLL